MDRMPLKRDADYTTERGARVLVARIKEYWRSRGLFPDVWAEPLYASNTSLNGNVVWQVRSAIRTAGAWTGRFGVTV